LVSGGEDGNIRIWNVLNADNTAKATITMPPRLAVNSLSLSPDGSFIAVATHDRVLVWRMGEHAIPKASWVPQPGWQSPSSTSDSEDVVPCLGWDAEGRRLVFGMENKVCRPQALLGSALCLTRLSACCCRSSRSGA
jgi:WD40 repeat protein